MPEDPNVALPKSACSGNHGQQGATASHEPASWAEAIRLYEAEKRPACIEQPKVERFIRARGRDWDARAKWNPVTQAPKDDNVHKRLMQQEQDDLVKTVTKGLQKDLDNSFVAYNLLNFNPKFGLTPKQAEECLRPTRTEGVRLTKPPEPSYDIITMESRGGLPPVKEVTSPKDGEYRRKRGQDIHISDRDYLQPNEIRQEELAARKREEVLHRLHSSKGVHPITGRYYNRAREEEAQEMEHHRDEAKKAQLHTISKPTTAALSEGAAYNVVTGETYDEAKCDRLDSLDLMRAASKAELRYRHGQYCDLLDELAASQEEASLKRWQRPEAFRPAISHQYDIITTKGFGLTKAELKTASEEDHMVHKLRGLQSPPVSLRLLEPQTVHSKLEDIARKAAASQEASRALYGPPTSTFEKTMQLPPPYDTSKTRFKKSAKAPVTGAANFASLTM